MKVIDNNIVVNSIMVAVMALFIYSCATNSINRTKPYVQLKQYGLFSPGISSTIRSNDVKITKATLKPELKEQTTHIPCELGNWFGVLINIYGISKKNSRNITVLWTHPKIVSSTGQTSTSTVFQWPIGNKKEDREEILLGWNLGKSELVPGNWTIFIYYEGDMLLRQTFTLEECNTV